MHRVVAEILASNDWRDREFAKFKVNSSGVEEELWCRMCIPMVYAHWEGFVVSSLKTLIDHLNSLGLPASGVPTTLVAVGLADAYQFLSGKQSFAQRVDFTNRFRDLIQDTIRFQKTIDTKSNLKASVLRELCHMYGFRFERFSSLTADIDRLVNVRNSIAHGENSFVLNSENVSKYIAAVTNAMDIFERKSRSF
ncbi:MAG: hypothetical protein IPK97_00765 [Ahniella sp.]|nr:hypothetical protein [Ahniella sp.]